MMIITVIDIMRIWHLMLQILYVQSSRGDSITNVSNGKRNSFRCGTLVQDLEKKKLGV
jgi:hypothetical protein